MKNIFLKRAKVLCTLLLSLAQSFGFGIYATTYNLTFAVYGGEGGTITLLHNVDGSSRGYTTVDNITNSTIGIYECTKSMNYTAVPAEGYEFDHWSWTYNQNTGASGQVNLKEATSETNPNGSKQMGSSGGSSVIWPNTTVYAHFRRVAATTYTVTWKSEDGSSTLETDADLASGTATAYNGTTPTKAPNAQYTYTFDGWATTAGGSLAYANGSTPAATADVTYYAHFSSTLRNYDVTFQNTDGYGSVSQNTIASVPYGTAITVSGSSVTINGTTVTATPSSNTAQYSYTFTNWTKTPNNATVTEAMTFTANFTRTTNTYTVAATVSPAGAGSVNITADGYAANAGTYDYNTNVTLTATPTNRRYQFSYWTDGGNNAGTDGVNTYTIDDIAANHNNVVAVFEEIPVTIADNEETSYYTATASTFTGSMDFQLMRTFYAGMWNTVCFPFDLTASQITASDMRTATFYTLSSVTGDAAEGLDFNVSEVTSLSARTPYLVQVSGANIVNPVFAGVTLAASAFTNNTTGTNVGDTRFFGTVHPTALETGENSGFLFLGQNNQLYWPNVANDIRAFRAYFYSGNNTVQAVHPRVRLVVRPETPTDVIEGYNADTWSAVVPARKVLDNGNLIIERDGIRYNAVGQIIR